LKPPHTATMTTVMIDNYDSFTYNVYQYLCELGAKVHVARNDKITVDEVKKLNPINIVISPGPGSPKDAGVSMGVIKVGQRNRFSLMKIIR